MKSKDVAGASYGFTTEQTNTISKHICTNQEKLDLFLAKAQALELDPFAGEILCDHRQSIIVSAGGFRKMATRTGMYRGQIGPHWCGSDGLWRDVWLEEGPPMAARVGVLRAGFSEPLFAVVTWKSFGSNAANWRTMPDHMLAKVAETHALRRAFPEGGLTGIYTQDEMELVYESEEKPKRATPPEAGEDRAAAQMAQAKEREQVEAVPEPAPEVPKEKAPSKGRGEILPSPDLEKGGYKLQVQNPVKTGAELKEYRLAYHRRAPRREQAYLPGEFAKVLKTTPEKLVEAESGKRCLSKTLIWSLHQKGFTLEKSWNLGTSDTRKAMEKKYGRPKLQTQA